MHSHQLKPGQGEPLPFNDPPVSQRSATRRALIQALYQWALNQSDAHAIINQFVVDARLEDCDVTMFRQMLLGVVAQAPALDEMFESYLDRSAKRLDPVEKMILRLGVFEMQSQLQTPYQVVINEAVELAKRFGGEQSHKYINGVLDRVAEDLRQIEKSSQSSRSPS